MATPVAGATTSYELNAGVKVRIDESIYMLSPTDLPLTLGVDAQNNMVLRTEPVDQIEYFWMDEEIMTRRVALAANVLVGDSALTVASPDGLKFRQNDLIRVVKAGASEIMRVSGTTTATNIPVTLATHRALFGTAATAFSTGDMIMGLGNLTAEGSGFPGPISRDRDLRSNYTQIYKDEIKMSRTQRQIARYGVPDEWAKQLFNRTRENWISLEQNILYGARSNNSTTKERTSGGLTHFLTGSNLNSTANSTFDVSHINAAQQVCYNLGDIPDVLVINPNTLSDLNNVADTNRVRQEVVDGRRGRARVTVIDTEFGTTTIIRNRWVYSKHAFMIKPETVVRRIFDPWQAVMLAKTTDSDDMGLVMEEGLQVKGYQHQYMWNNLTNAANLSV